MVTRTFPVHTTVYNIFSVSTIWEEAISRRAGSTGWASRSGSQLAAQPCYQLRPVAKVALSRPRLKKYFSLRLASSVYVFKILIKHVVCVSDCVWVLAGFCACGFSNSWEQHVTWCQALLWRYCPMSLQGAHSKHGDWTGLRQQCGRSSFRQHLWSFPGSNLLNTWVLPGV